MKQNDRAALGSSMTAETGSEMRQPNGGCVDVPRGFAPGQGCIHRLVERRALEQPAAVAIIGAEGEITYGELNDRANRLHWHLLQLGIGPGARVGVQLPRSPELVTAELAILKCGAAYVALDDKSPGERQASILADSGAQLVLTGRGVRVPAGVRIRELQIEDLELDAGPWDESKPELSDEAAAYVMYTSGSTNLPKGVEVPHRAVRNLALNHGYARLEPGDRVAFVANPAFGPSTIEVWATLLNGGCIVVVDRSTLLDVECFAELLRRREVNILHLTAGLFTRYADRLAPVFPQLRYLMVGGDVVDTGAVERTLRNAAPQHFVHTYGTTEATVFALSYEIRAVPTGGRRLPIGQPIANVAAYVLDEDGRRVPKGTIGELHIGGAGIAHGYINAPDLTAQRFLPDPFAAQPGARMYRTGDLARYGEDGEIEFVGRSDFQVKLRDHRVELGEIEARLRSTPGLKDLTVVAREDSSGEKRLVAYYTIQGEAFPEPTAEGLRTQLQAHLPDYMVPAAYVRLDQFPLTANGKLDRRALPPPDASAYITSGYEPPTGELEQALAKLWCEVLGVERVGRNDDFFSLGGHSLSALKLVERMHHQKLHARAGVLFNAPTLGAFAAATSLGLARSSDAGAEPTVRPSLIPADCAAITPEMVPLLELTHEEIAEIVARVPGGARNVQDMYPLLPLQEGILFHHLLEQDGDPYLSSLLLRFESRARMDAYLAALQAVVDRHGTLRTAVHWEGLRRAVQVVWRRAVIEVWEGEPQEAERAMSSAADWGWGDIRLDLGQAPLLRVYVARVRGTERWLLLRQIHHVAADQRVLEAIDHEIGEYLGGRACALPEPMPLRSFVAQALESGRGRASAEFFARLLGDVEECTSCFGLMDTRGDGTGIEEARREVEPGLASRLRERARAMGVSAASVGHLGWALVVCRASGRDDVVFGTVVMGHLQSGPGAERVLGPFINTLPVRVRLGRRSVVQSVRETHALLAELIEHEQVPLPVALQASKVKAPAPLFTALFNYRRTGVAGERAAEAWRGIEVLGQEERTNYPLAMSMDDGGEAMTLTAQTLAGVGAERVCEMMHRALDELVWALESAPEKALWRLDVLPRAERHTLLERWSGTPSEQWTHQCMHQLFEQRAAQQPDSVAVSHAGEEVSYGELNARANRLARYLRHAGVEPDVRVGLCMERSIQMVVALLAIAKAGGAYVPFEPSHPVERLEYMLDDSEAALILTHPGLPEATRCWLRGTARAAIRRVIDLDADDGLWRNMPSSNLDSSEVRLTPQHLAYVLYTSGSTGKPKGVMIEHGGLSNYLQWARAEYAPSSAIVSSSLGFDATVTSLYTPLLNGGTLHLLHSGDELEELYDRLRQETQPGLLKLTPAHMEVLGARLAAEKLTVFDKTFVIGGEALATATVRRWREMSPGSRLINEYGPTETVVGCVTYEVPSHFTERATIPIGRPIANARLYILDQRGMPAPVGVPGELHIGGPGVARGYAKRPDLTAERFLPDPFSGEGGARMYATGDLGRFLEDGSIEFLGRNDDQIKLRGFRIELGEIEWCLTAHPGVEAAAVLLRRDPRAGEQLVAYYTRAADMQGPGVDAEALRAHLRARLPEYMLPAAYVEVAAFPLTANGKLDRRALPEPELEAYVARGYEAPEGEVESTLARLWRELLGVPRVGRSDDFFELGGHSLLAMTLVEQMRREGLHAKVSVLFANSKLSELASSVSKEAASLAVPPNLIAEGCDRITPELLPLVALTQAEIDLIVSRVDGGARNVQDIYPLAPLQDGILFHHLLHNDNDPYLSSSLMRFDSRQRLDSYIRALDRVIARHDVLRTAVQWEGLSKPVQVVWRRTSVQLEVLNLDASEGDVAEHLRRRFSDGRQRIDIARAPLLRWVAAPDGESGRWILLTLVHHLFGDNATLKAMLAEIQAQLLGQSDEVLPPVAFRNFVAQASSSVGTKDHESFFRALLGDVYECTAPFGFADARDDGELVADAQLVLPAALTRRLRAGAKSLRTSVACLCHVAWARVLSGASARQDVVFGTVMFGRTQGGAGVDRALGMFINTLPIRIQLAEDDVEACVRKTHALLAELLRHEHAPLALVQRWSGVKSPMPLFTALLNYRHPAGALPAAGAESTWEGVDFLGGTTRTSYPLTLSIDDFRDGLALTALVRRPVSARPVCELMQRALESLVDAIESSRRTPVRRLDILPPAERQRLLEEWNATAVEYPNNRCIHELIEDQARDNPSALAVTHEAAELTYGELNERANQLAHHLRKLGVKPDRCVAICGERSVEMIVGLLAILKAGGAYVPLDPSYPAERLAYMLSDSQPVALLTHGGVPAEVRQAASTALGGPGVRSIDLSVDAGRWANESRSDPGVQPVGLTPQHLAYVIYTSGSTGKPKGVMVEHAGVVNHLIWRRRVVDLRHEDVVLQRTAISFDVAAWEMWTPLVSGARLLLLHSRDQRDPRAIADAIVRHGVTCTQFVPTLLRAVVAYEEEIRAARWRCVFSGGEALDQRLAEDVDRLFPGALVNVYGPTEATIDATVWRYSKAAGNESIPIGRPVANTRIYILDPSGEPVPQGAIGELYIGGVQVARGYLNRPELTAERFIRDPFVPDPLARMYKTGDLARYLPDGEVEFLGRNDSQVKIRGFRIELEEIEARLLTHPCVRDAAVIVREDMPGERRLVAYYTQPDAAGVGVDAAADVDGLREHLSAALPEYMVPAAYVRLDQLPVTPNGKLDRRALPEPARAAYEGGGEYEEPLGSIEQTLARLWRELLRVDRVGRRDNFFALGGHSLLVVGLMERMRREGLHTDVRSVFAAPTLMELAARVGGAKQSVIVPPSAIPRECSAITPDMVPLVRLSQKEIDQIVNRVPGGTFNIQDIYPLAPLQEGILFHHLMAETHDPYLRQYGMRFSSRARLDAYIRGLQAVIERHDILRTGVQWEGLSEPVQVVCRRAPLVVEEVDVDASDRAAFAVLSERFAPSGCRMDVTQAPLMRMYVAREADGGRWSAVVLTHHLWVDHTTLEILQNEVEAHLLGEEQQLGAPPPYRNFVAHARWGIKAEEHETFFRQMLGDIEESTAPFGLMAVRGDGSRIGEDRRRLDPSLTRRLRDRAKAANVSTACLCHVAWAQVLSRTSGRDDVVFGTVLFGRMHGDSGADRVLGMLMNTLPVRMRVGSDDVQSALKQMHDLLTELMRHEHASLALAQRCSGVPAPAPLFTSLLNYRHVSRREAGERAKQAWEGIELLLGTDRTSYPLTFSVDDFGDEIWLTVQVEAPAEATVVIDLMERALKGLANALESAPRTALSEVDVLPASEEDRLASSKGECVHQWFEQHAQRSPHAVAVECEGREVSYGELNAKANQLARYLRRLGVKPEARVGICLERSVDMITGLMAILKAGGAYVPLDPSYPTERLAYMLKDSAPEVVLTHGSVSAEVRGELARVPGQVLDLGGDGSRWREEAATDLNAAQVGVGPQNLAYVIYTSGSTGKPKGVMVRHGNVARLFTATRTSFDVSSLDVWTQFHSLAFDFSVWEIWGALVNGSRLVIVPRSVARSPHEFYELLSRSKVTILNQTPSAFRQLIAAQDATLPHALRYVIFGGEALEVEMLDPWRARDENRHTRLVNMYGITETTVHVTHLELDPATEGGRSASPIGRPIADLTVYILDARGRQVPAGVQGEMYVGGSGVTRGYLNRPEMTAERFVPDRFSKEVGARLYKTGDLARYRSDGSMEFLGRNDQQVKLRGHRIELGEIEAKLRERPEVAAAVVLLREDSPGDERLVAYYVPTELAKPEALGPELFGSELSKVLPEYMIPAAYVQLESMPLTSNGKLDRRGLPAPERGSYAGRDQYEAPVGELEQALARVWQDVLGVERVGRRDNFFALGGHSLTAVALVERMRQQELYTDVRSVFAAPTLAGLVEHVGRISRVTTVPANGIPRECRQITPEMLPLISLSQEQIDGLVSRVPGGAHNVQDIYPLAPLQEGILFHHLLNERTDSYLTSTLLQFQSRERLDRYVSALRALIERHDILRTGVHWEGLPEPVQVVCRRAPLHLQEVVLTPADGPRLAALKERFDPRNYRMDVTQAPLMQMFATRDGDHGGWIAVLLIHHLCVDHTAMEILQNEVEAHLLGEERRLAQPLPYRNFVARARWGMSPEEHQAFFRRMLSDIDESTAPFGLLEVRGAGGEIAEGRRRLKPDLSKRLRGRARALNVSTACLCHVAWARVLSRTSGRNDVVFGTVLLGRMQGDVGADRVLGMLMNTLPVRLRVGSESVTAAVKHMHQLLTDLLRHEHASLALAQRSSRVEPPAPLFTSLLNYRHTVAERSQGARQAWEGIEFLASTALTNYPLTLSVDDYGNDLGLHALVAAPIEPGAVIELMEKALDELVRALEGAPQTPLSDLDVLPVRERQKLLVEWNATEAAYDRGKCVHHWFEDQVRRNPAAVAIVSEDGEVSYEELNAKANRLARYLRRLGVDVERRVGICVQRSVEMVVGLLAILKAGGAYVPLDPDYPTERLGYMVMDCEPEVVLTHGRVSEATREELARAGKPVLDLAADGWRWVEERTTDPEPGGARVSQESLAYVMYTSGSTGTPKGVAVEHRAVANCLSWMQSQFGLNDADTVLQKTPFGFDVSVWELFWPLIAGAKVVMVRAGGHRDPDCLVAAVRQHAVTTLHFSPSLLQLFLSHREAGRCESVVRVLSSGEALTGAAVRQFQDRMSGATLYNVYGPTETFGGSAWPCDGTVSDEVPIGRPFANTQLYVLDGSGDVVPVGVTGELYIGGSQVARGYLNRAALTAERFVPDPFAKQAGSRMYKTGDLARYRRDGALEYLGRNDFQIKIRGYRVELGEIEARLKGLTGVVDAAVLLREDEPGNQRLVAYLVQSAQVEATKPEAFVAELSKVLPEYMVPAAYVRLDYLPLTVNGKLDRKGLPAPERGAYPEGDERESPVGEVEQALAQVWRDVLEVERVGRRDNFFALGGHSLTAVALIERMRQQGLYADVRALFAAPTLLALAAVVKREDSAVVVPPNRIPENSEAITPDMLPWFA